MGGSRVVGTRTTQLLVGTRTTQLLVLVALVAAGTLTAAYAQEVNWRPLAVDMEVVEVVREPTESGDKYTVTINATSTGAETLYVDIAQVISDGQSYANECGSGAWLQLEPDETLALAGCYTVPEQSELELVFLAGFNQSEGRPDAFKLLPFLEHSRLTWCGPGGYYADDSFCESTVRMAPFLRDVKGAAGPPSVPVENAVQNLDGPDDILLSRAEYSGETGDLVLYFDDPIYPFSIYVSRVTILHDKCDGIALSVSEFGGRVSLDRQYVTFKLDDDNRQALPGMTNPRIHLAPGAFADDATRTKNAPGDVPLLVAGVDSPPRADQQQGVVRTASCMLTYGLVEPPSVVLDEVDYGADFVAEHSEVVRQAIRDGFAAWTELNPGMAFEEVDSGRPDIIIQWIEFAGEHVGYACLDCLRAGAIIELALEQPDCRGNQVAYGPGMIRNVLAHEFGHNLGLGHTDDEDHLMSGSTPPPEPGRFNDLGYNIPERIPGYLVGAKPLVERYDALYDEYRNSNSVSHRNALVGPINSLADRLNCMYNVSVP